MSLNDIDRISNLWKKSRGVNDIRKSSNYVNPAQTAFKENIFNEAIFSQEVPDELPGNLITSNIGTIHPESVEYLDYSFNSVGVNPGDIAGTPGSNTPQLFPYFGTKLTSVPQLTYYHRIPLEPNNNADDTKPTNVTKSTWYLPDPSDNKLSLLRDTINFKTGTRGDYVYKIYSAPAGLAAGQTATPVQEVADPYSLVFDNKNGLLYLYGDDSASNWRIGASEVLYISFIRYEGTRGAGSGSGGITPGSDVSFNNVEITGDLTFNHNGLETGILQSKSIALDSHTSFQAPTSTVIAEISFGSTQNPMTATGYFTIELNEGDPHTHTKIHFLAGVTSDKNSQGTFDYITFIKVLNVNRQRFGAGLINPGIKHIEIWSNPGTDKIFLALDHELIGTPNVNVRLYKNSSNLLNTINEKQWTLGKNYTLDLLRPSPPGPDRKLKKIYISSGPDIGTGLTTPLYPNHPEEPFNATTEYTIIDNSMNVYGNVNITGDANLNGSLKIDTDLVVGGDTYLQSLQTEKITGAFSDLYEYKIFTNATYSSETDVIGFGAWQTIAHIPKITAGSNAVPFHDITSSNALFEIIDRSNPNTNYSFKDTISFIVNVSERTRNIPCATLTLLSSNTCRNDINITSTTGNYGYIEKIRVLIGGADTTNTNNGQVGALVQLFRKSNQPTGSGVTSLRINMYNNLKIFNTSTGTGVIPFILDVPPSSYFTTGRVTRSIEFDLTNEGHGSKNMYMTTTASFGFTDSLHVKRGTLASSFDKIKTNYITEAENDIKILVDDDILAAQQPTFSNKIIIGNSNNETTHSISFFGGNTTTPLQSAVLNLNGNSGNGVKTGDLYYQNSSGDAGVGDTLINSVYTKGHYTDELCNPALVQPIKIDLTTAGLNVSDNDWITLAVVGKSNLEGRRASALFELSERSGGHQQSIIFRAGMSYSSITTNEYDNQKNNYIEVISNIYYSEIRFLRLRIKYNSSASNTDGTTGTQTTRKIIYGGGVLQVQINGNANDPGPNPPAGSGLTPTPQPPNYLYLKIYQNTKSNGWVSNSSVIRNYSQNEDIPVYDTTYNGSNGTTGEIYTLDKTVSLTAKNHITTTQEKTFKFCGSGITVTNTDKYYLDTIEDSDSGWPSRPSPGSEIQIKLDRMGINMNKSTITHLWDIPQSWIRHITQQTNSNGDTVYEPNPEKVGGAFSSSGGHREGVAVSISTLQNYYQQMEQPFKLYRGGQASITGALSKTTLTNSYNFTDGFLAMLSEGPETTNNTKKANAIVYRNDFMDGVYNVGTSGMNLEWRTKFDWTNTEIVRGQANNGINDTPYSFGLTGLDEFDSTGNKFSSTGGWTWTNGTNQNNYIYVNTSQAAPENNYITFRGKIVSSNNINTFSEYVNDSLFLAGEGRGFDLFGLRNKWHIMPQKNMSAYVLSAYLYLQHQSSSFSIDFGGTPANAPHQVQFILCGTTFSTSSSGNNTIRELTTLATITNTNASNDTVDPSWSRLHNTGSDKVDNNWIRWYPNGGNGEFSKGIYIGRTYEQKFDSIVESDQRFDALSIRVKVRVRNTSSSFSATSVTIRGAPARLGFYISPLIRSVP